MGRLLVGFSKAFLVLVIVFQAFSMSVATPAFHPTVVQFPPAANITLLAWSPDGKTLLYTQNGNLESYPPATKIVADKGIRYAQWNVNGSHCVIGDGKKAFVFDPKTFSVIRTIPDVDFAWWIGNMLAYVHPKYDPNADEDDPNAPQILTVGDHTRTLPARGLQITGVSNDDHVFGSYGHIGMDYAPIGQPALARISPDGDISYRILLNKKNSLEDEITIGGATSVAPNGVLLFGCMDRNQVFLRLFYMPVLGQAIELGWNDSHEWHRGVDTTVQVNTRIGWNDDIAWHADYFVGTCMKSFVEATDEDVEKPTYYYLYFRYTLKHGHLSYQRIHSTLLGHAMSQTGREVFVVKDKNGIRMIITDGPVDRHVDAGGGLPF